MASTAESTSSTGTTAQNPRAPQQLPAATPLAEIREVMDRDGVVVLNDVIDADTLAHINAEFDPLLEETPLGSALADEGLHKDTIDFLGHQTKRVNSAITRVPDVSGHLVANPFIIPVIESILKEHCTSILIHQCQLAETHPGQPAQDFHRDDGLWKVEGKRFIMSCQSIIALGDFTAETGGTRFVLGSHRWPEALHYDPEEEGGWRRYGRFDPAASDHDYTTVEMPAGSAVIWNGALFHSAGGNTTEGRVRRAFILAYSLGWLRGELNQQLMWPPEVAKTFPREVQRVIGYSYEEPFIGCLEMGQDPITLLE